MTSSLMNSWPTFFGNARTIVAQGGQQEQKGTKSHGNHFGTPPNIDTFLEHFRSIL